MRTLEYLNPQNTEIQSLFPKALIIFSLFILLSISAWAITRSSFSEPTDSATVKGTVTGADDGLSLPFTNVHH